MTYTYIYIYILSIYPVDYPQNIFVYNPNIVLIQFIRLQPLSCIYHWIIFNHLYIYHIYIYSYVPMISSLRISMIPINNPRKYHSIAHHYHDIPILSLQFWSFLSLFKSKTRLRLSAQLSHFTLARRWQGNVQEVFSGYLVNIWLIYG